MINVTKKAQRAARSHAGFTLAETIIVIAVMAILLTMAFPNIVTFLQMQSSQQEESDMLEIQKALRLYAEEKGKLPDFSSTDDNSWAEELSAFTSMSANQIYTDRWDNPRLYRVFNTQKQYREGTMSTYYATVLSLGADRCLDTGTVLGYTPNRTACVTPAGITKTISTFFGITDPVNAPLGNYDQLQADPNGDDQLIKFTDVQIKAESYNRTVMHLEKLSEALEVYARSRYNEEASDYGNCVVTKQRFDAGLAGVTASDVTAACDTGRNPTWTARIAAGRTPDNTIYYPPAVASDNVDDNGFYAPLVVEDIKSFINSGNRDRVRNTTTDIDRRADMQALTRLLGLPESYCCSALARGSDDLPKPFFYFSNPRPRTGVNSCGARPANPPYLPARITVDYVSPGANGATCG